MNARHTRRTHVKRWAAVLTLAAAATLCPDAHADGATAAEHARRAQVAFDVQNWAGAAQEYQAAYQAEQKPDYLWGLAQAQRLGGDCVAAIRSYKAFKRAEVSATQGTAAEMQITKCEAEMEKKEAEAARKSAEAPAATATAGSVSPAPTPATPAATHGTVPAADQAAPSGPKPFYADVLGDALVVGGLGAAGVGAYFLFSGNADMKASSGLPTYKAYDTRVDDAAKKQTIGGILLGAGGGLVTLGVLRWLTMDHGDSAPRAEKTSVLVGPASVEFRARF
jgi:hypothetical protein